MSGISFLDSNATLDRKDQFARDFNAWDANKDGVINIQEVHTSDRN